MNDVSFESCARDAAANDGRRRFLNVLFAALDDLGIRYCVLHSWRDLPDHLSSDLDIVMHPKDTHNLVPLLHKLRSRGYTVVQMLNYAVGAYYFVFFWREAATIGSLAVDIIVEHRRGGLVMPSGEALVLNRRRYGAFWIPAPEPEFTYLLAKKAWKGYAPPRQAARLCELVEQLGSPEAERLAGRLFLGRAKKRAIAACASSQLDKVLAQLKGRTWATALLRSPHRLLIYVVADGVRRVRRWIQPSGFLVAVMGPDGAGKTTLIGNLVSTVGPAFRQHRILHLRPFFLGFSKTAGAITAPHAQKTHGRLVSIGKLAMYLADYWLGYAFVIRPLLARSGLVVFDRYFDDVAIDPTRYRYGGPLWIARLLISLAPRPDYTIILDSAPESILSRKQETTAEMICQLRSRYLSYQSKTPNSRMIDAADTISDVAVKAASTIVEALARRFNSRYRRWAPGSRVNA